MDQPLPGESPKPKNLGRLIPEKELEILEKDSATDTLTGLYNRRGFIRKIEWLKKTTLAEELRKQIEESKNTENSQERRKQPEQQEYALLLIDIDNFKNFNDTYGHKVGDEVLKTAAIFLTRQFRPTDTICRWGGEEFTILLQDLKKTDFLNRLTKRLSSNEGKELSTLNFPFEMIETTEIGGEKTYRQHKSGEQYNVLPNETILVKIIAFSGGIVPFAPSKDNLDETIANADNHLYNAKKAGRDQIETTELE